MNNEKIAKIKSKYLLNEIFSFIKYEQALKIMKYNKALQMKLNIALNDYTIDCIFTKRLEEREYGEYMINKKSNDNSFLSISIILLELLFFAFSIININYWKNNFYNIYLSLDLVYKAVIIFYLIMKKCWNLKNDECMTCYFCLEFFFNSILLIILILKIISDKKDKNNKNVLYKINSVMISVCIIILFVLSIYLFVYIKTSQKPNSAIIKKIKKEEKYIAIINEFRGFKINTCEYSSLNAYGLITSEDIEFLLKSHLNYTITKSHIDLINLINKLRKKKNLKELKYYATEHLYDFFIHVKRFYAIDNINKIDNNIYLFIYPRDEFKSMILENDDKIMNILYNNIFEYILILEKNNNEYILIYSSNNKMFSNKNNDSTEDTDRKDLLKLKQNY
jgi:hypothetical protein